MCRSRPPSQHEVEAGLQQDTKQKLDDASGLHSYSRSPKKQ